MEEIPQNDVEILPDDGSPEILENISTKDEKNKDAVNNDTVTNNNEPILKLGPGDDNNNNTISTTQSLQELFDNVDRILSTGNISYCPQFTPFVSNDLRYCCSILSSDCKLNGGNFINCPKDKCLTNRDVFCPKNKPYAYINDNMENRCCQYNKDERCLD